MVTGTVYRFRQPVKVAVRRPGGFAARADARDAWETAVRNAEREIRAEQVERLRHADEVRRAAWAIIGAPERLGDYGHGHANAGHRVSWRNGFRALYAALQSVGRDLTAIPHYDTLAQELAWYFPEWRDRTEDLWAFLLTPYEQSPSREKIRRMAEERVGELVFSEARRVGVPF